MTLPRSGRSQSPGDHWVISGGCPQPQVFVEILSPPRTLSPAPGHALCSVTVCGGGGGHLPIYLIDFILLFSLSLCPKVPRSHHGSGPSSQSQDRGKGLMDATPTLSLPPGLQPGLASGLYWALGSGEKADSAA